MASFMRGLGGFAQGLMGGLDEGNKLSDRRMQQQAMEAWGNTLSSIGQAPPPPGGQQNGAAMGAPQPPQGQQAGSDNIPAPPAFDNSVRTQPMGGPAGYQDAIGRMETGGRANAYTTEGPVTRTGDRAEGKYGIMGANIPEWSKAALGHPITREQFLADPKSQDAIFNDRFGGYVKQTGNPQDAASMWLTGRTLANGGAGAKDQLGTSGAAYAAKAFPGGQQQPGQLQQPQGAPQQGGQQGGMPTGPFNMQQVAMAIKKANPNASPQVIAMAMQNALPFMNAESQQQYKQFNEQMRMQQLDLNRQKESDTNQYRDQKLQQSWERSRTLAENGKLRLEQGQQRLDELTAQRAATNDNRQQKLLDEQIKIARENKTTTVNALANLLRQAGSEGANDPAIKAEIEMLKADLARYNQPDAAPSTPPAKASGGSTTPSSKPRNEDATPVAPEGGDAKQTLEFARAAIKMGAPAGPIKADLKAAGIDPSLLDAP